LAGEIQARNGGNSAPGNAFEGNIGVDYMGFSIDFVGGKIFDAVSASVMSQAQLVASNATAATAVSAGLGQIGATVSDNTVFSVGARYVIGPWKFFGGYEHIDYANPNNPLNPGAFTTGGFILGAGGAINNTNFNNDKILQTAWIGVKYSITPALDITGAYYHEWQNSFGSATDAPFQVFRHDRRRIGGDGLALRPAHGHVRRRDVVASAERLGERLPARERQHCRCPPSYGRQQGLVLRSHRRSPLPVLMEA
jgi:predicted porin